MEGKFYLWPKDYMADPSVHVWNGRVYIYPSHDWDAGVGDDDSGAEYEMKDYHVFSTDDLEAVCRGEKELVDHGCILDLKDIPWASHQLWDNDVQEKDGKYFMYFPAKDKTEIFRTGIAVADKPEGPFVPLKDPMHGSYSIDYAVFKDEKDNSFQYFINDFSVSHNSIISQTFYGINQGMFECQVCKFNNMRNKLIEELKS